MSSEKIRKADKTDWCQLTFDSITTDVPEKKIDDELDRKCLCETGRTCFPLDVFSCIDDSSIPVCVCEVKGKIVYRNFAAKKYLPELRRGLFMRKLVGDMSFELYNSLCDHPGSAECIHVIGTGSAFRNAIAACFELDGMRYTIWMFFRVLQFAGYGSLDSELVECLREFAKNVVSDDGGFFLTSVCNREHHKRMFFSDERVYDSIFGTYIPNMFTSVPAYHVVDTVSRLMKKYVRELGMRVGIDNNISGDRFRHIGDHIAFVDMCLRVFSLFAEHAVDRNVKVEFSDGEDNVIMCLTFRIVDSDAEITDVQTFSDFFGRCSKSVLDAFCIDHMAKMYGWQSLFSKNGELAKCDISIPILRVDSFGVLKSAETEADDVAFVVSELENYIAFVTKLSVDVLKNEEEG